MSDQEEKGPDFVGCTVMCNGLRVVGEPGKELFFAHVRTADGKILKGQIWLHKDPEASFERITKVFGDFTSLEDLRRVDYYLGVLVDVSTRWNEFNGRRFLEVAFFNRHGDVACVDDSQFASMTQKLNGLLARYQATKKPGTPPKRVQVAQAGAPAPAEAADTADDLPF